VVVPADASQELVVERALADEKVKAAIAGKQIVKTIFVPGKLLNFVVR
jgi:leucyl-tRNA synthetase